MALARSIGQRAFLLGHRREPYNDRDIKRMLRGRQVFIDPPKGEATNIEIMACYLEGWDFQSYLKEPKKK